VSVDLKDAERLGLLKMDYLGLNTMTLINYACTWLGLELQDMYDLPLDDQTTLDGFRRGDVIGIFQYEGQATRLINNELKPDNFDEVCLVPAIARPGPLHNGAAEAYVQVKRGDVEPERWHPSLEPILGFTNHQIVYQEQILRIVREVGDFDWTAAAAIRKIIAKKEGEQAFNRKRQEFLDGAARRHPDFEPDKVYALWMSLITAGAYSFNLAHSLAYGMISYQCQWIKQHHPEVFYAAALRAMGDGARVPLLRDADAHAIKATPPKLGGKALDWTPVRDGGKVRMGYKQLPKVGDALAEEIVRTPGRRRWTAWEDMIEVKGIGPKTIEGIKEFGASDDPLGIFEIDKRIAIAREAIEASETMTAPTHSSLDVPYGEGLKETVTWVGVALNRNLRDIFETNRAHGTELDEATMKDPHLREFLLMLGDDGKELLRLRFDRWRYPQFKRPIWGTTLEKDVVWVQGYKPSWRAAREIYVTDFAVISVTDEEVAQWNQATSKTGSPSTRRTRPKVRFTRRSAIAA
jgi:DNA polymerase-3 subunit alpha